MTGIRTLGVLLLLVLGACPEDGPSTLIVELRTDLVPGIEFERFELVGDSTLTRQVATGETGADWARPTPMGEFDLDEGVYSFRARLRQGSEIVVARDVVVQVRGRTGVQLYLTRDCRDVSCDAEEACFFGRCVEAECLNGTEPSCEFEPQCDVDEDCVASTPCAPLSCEPAGFCFPAEYDCPAGEYCDAVLGCEPIAPVGDAGPDDAGPDDAGPDDAGPDDAGTDDAGVPLPGWLLELENDTISFVDLDAGVGGPCVFFDTTGGFTLSSPAASSAVPGVHALCLEGSEPLLRWQDAEPRSVSPGTQARFDCDGDLCAWSTLADRTVAHNVIGPSASDPVRFNNDKDAVYAVAARDAASPERVYVTLGGATTRAFFQRRDVTFDTWDLGNPVDLVTDYADGSQLLAVTYRAPYSANVPGNVMTNDRANPDTQSGFWLSARPDYAHIALYAASTTTRVLDFIALDSATTTYALLVYNHGLPIDVLAPSGSTPSAFALGAGELGFLLLDANLRLLRVSTQTSPFPGDILDAALFDAGETLVTMLRSDDLGEEFAGFHRQPLDFSAAPTELARVRAESVARCAIAETTRGYCAGLRSASVTIDGIRQPLSGTTDAWIAEVRLE